MVTNMVELRAVTDVTLGTYLKVLNGLEQFCAIDEKVPIYCWVDRAFHLSDGEAQHRTHDLPVTFCTITKPL